MQLRAFLEGNTSNLDCAYELEHFINNLQYGDQYLAKTHDEQNSSNSTVLAKYKQHQIVVTLESLSALITPARTTLVPRTTPLTTPLKQTSLTYKSRSTKPVNLVDFDERNPLNIGHYTTDDEPTVDMYICAINKAVYGNAFDVTKDPCLACGQSGHTFNDCPVLQNTEFLRKHYIRFCSFIKRMRRDCDKEPLPVNSLETTQESIPDDVTPPDKDTDTDFHPGQN